MIKKLRQRILSLIRDSVNRINIYDYVNDLQTLIIIYRKENHSLSGSIKILEEQQEIMHNFLVEINKYLVSFSDKNQKEMEMGYQSMGDKSRGKSGKKSENNEGRVEKSAEKKLKDKKMRNEYKPGSCK